MEEEHKTIFDNRVENELQQERKENEHLHSKQNWYKTGFFVLLLILTVSLIGNAYLAYFMNQVDNRNADAGMKKQTGNGLVPPEENTPVTLTVAPSTQPAQDSFTVETKEFTSQPYGFTFLYPASWAIEEGKTQMFQQGDVVTVRIVGETQAEGTEFYDGAYFSVMKPVESDKTAEAWVKERYTETVDPSRPTQFSRETINGIQYEKAYVCGLGCYNYYHTKRDNMIYGFIIFSGGPKEAELNKLIRNIMESFTFTPRT